MDWFKPVARYVFAPLYNWKDGSAFLRYLRQYERSQYESREDIERQQWEQAKQMVKYAYANCPFYTKKYDAAGFHPDQLVNRKDMERVPVLSKAEIQEHAEDMIGVHIPKDSIISNYTGGSTGSPLRLYHDKKRMEQRLAGTMRHDRWGGRDVGDRLACIWGAPVDFQGAGSWKARLRNTLYERLLYLDTTHMTKATMESFVKQLVRYKPQYYLAYANAISLFARYIEQTGGARFPLPRAIYTSAEVLTAENRELIERVFGCPVFDNYGCREVSTIASECEKHNGMHVNAESVLLEIIKDGKAVADGELGEIVVTDLHNRVMPLIRYRVGDAGVAMEQSCSCGRGLPMMRMAAGRTTDFIVTPEGALVSGVVLSTYLITKLKNIRQVRFVQKQVETLLIQLVPEGDQDIDSGQVKQLAAQYLGNSIQVELEQVGAIEAEKSGKFRFTISELDPLKHVK